MQWNAREMEVTLKISLLLCVVLNCNGASLREQLANTARRFSMDDGSVIIGSPSFPNHLPEAEAILPAHTLIRPALGMLKSALKFPHRELDNGAGVYGNINNLGLRYDSRNERLMYSGFRRTDTPPKDFVMLIPESDSSIEEEVPQLRRPSRNKYPKNIIKKIKIFPAKINHKKPSNWHDKRQPLILTPLKREPRWSHQGRDNILRIGRSVESRLHSHAKTLSFTKKLLEKIRDSKKRRLQDSNIIELNLHSPIVYANGELDQNVEGLDSSDPEKSKQSKLQHLQGKHAFNYIKINADAPEYEDYLPADLKKDNTDYKKWWYYHQSDFISFEEQED